jgi:hypothetical protein
MRHIRKNFDARISRPADPLDRLGQRESRKRIG